MILRILIVILSCSFLTNCNNQSQKQKPQKASKGKIDLTEWDFDKYGDVNLAGDFAFYWQQHIQPSLLTDSSKVVPDNFIDVHSSWNGHEINGQKLPGHGYATYHITVLLKSDQSPLALKFLDMGTAFSVFCNGDSILSVGYPGKSFSETRPQYQPQIVSIPKHNGKLELVFHVSNFHHRKGGAWETIKLGTEKQL